MSDVHVAREDGQQVVVDEWQQKQMNLHKLNKQKLEQCFFIFVTLMTNTPLAIEPGIICNVVRLLRFSLWLEHTSISACIQEPGSSEDIVEKWGHDQTLVRIDIICELCALDACGRDMIMLLNAGLETVFRSVFDIMEPAGVNKVDKRFSRYRKPYLCWEDLKCIYWVKVVFHRDFSGTFQVGYQLIEGYLNDICSFVREPRPIDDGDGKSVQ